MTRLTLNLLTMKSFLRGEQEVVHSKDKYNSSVQQEQVLRMWKSGSQIS